MRMGIVKPLWLTALVAAAALNASVTMAADEAVIESAAKRFATPESPETPDFRQHVMPLLGRLGCNGRACHGSFQGQGGFRLSLFGYDAELDYKGLAERLDLAKPEASYALQKPLLEEPHRGGKRMEKGSWEHNVLVSWIKGGAKKTADDAVKLTSVEITPKEIVFVNAGEQARLKVVGVWSDGRREDVTCLTRFQTNDEQVAEISKDGVVSSKQTGDTHIVVYYDNKVLPIPVMRAVTDKTGDKYPTIETKTKVDELVLLKLKKLGVLPSELAGDTEFLRRLSLDLAGTLPTPKEIQEFVADVRVDKRSLKISELTERPAYASWWATRLCDWTGNSNNQRNNGPLPQGTATRDWYEWLRVRIEQNVGYDKMAEGFVLASSREKGESYRELCEELTHELYAKDGKGTAHRASVPQYWTRNNFVMPEDRVIGFAYNFLGVRIQCAQCHKHPFDQWTQDDFHQFKNFFVHTKSAGRSSDSKADYEAIVAELGVDLKKNMTNAERTKLMASLAKDGKTIPFDEVFTTKVVAKNEARAEARKGKDKEKDAKAAAAIAASRKSATARLLGGADVELSEFDDPRQPLMDWLRSKDNKLFARAFVNRVWANYFNVGIVQPPDDHNLANPPSNAPLLNYLSEQFIEHNFDIKWLHREICSSETYQRSWTPNETNKADERNFSHAVPRRLPAEVAYDALVAATASDEEFAAMHSNVSGRSIAIPGAGGRGAGNGGGKDYALGIFGRSIRESNCDCDRSTDASLLQTVYLQNDQEVLGLINRGKGGWINQAGLELGLIKSKQADPKRGPEAEVRKLEELVARMEKVKQKAEARKDEKGAADAAKKVDELKLEIAELKAKVPTEEVVQTADADKLATVIRATYLRTLSRLPSETELTRSIAYVDSTDNKLRGVSDILWALINTKEFIVNH